MAKNELGHILGRDAEDMAFLPSVGIAAERNPKIDEGPVEHIEGIQSLVLHAEDVLMIEPSLEKTVSPNSHILFFNNIWRHACSKLRMVEHETKLQQVPYHDHIQQSFLSGHIRNVHQ